MNNQQLLDNAPEGDTSVNKHNQYLWFDGEESFVFNPEEKEWVLSFYEECTLEGIRSLADIRRIAELESSIRKLMGAITLESQENVMYELEELLEEQEDE